MSKWAKSWGQKNTVGDPKTPEKEIFLSIRNLKQKFSLRLRLVIIVTFELVISVLAAYGIDAVFVSFFEDYWSVPILVELIIIALLVGMFLTGILTRWFIDPIKKVGEAMYKIAGGDFSCRLQTRSNSKEIREIYSGFNMMANELQSTEIIQSDFVTNVSHEFKTPISAIEGYSMLLQGDDNLTDEQKEYIDKIIFNTKRLSTLTGSILLLSRLDNQSIISNRSLFDLDEQIRKAILALENAWEKKNIDFDIDLDETDYLGNEALMYHIWDNLISNAIKFTPSGSTVRIRLSNLSEHIVFTVSDMGPGISDEESRHIFDKFYQADSSHRQEGNGLGLALAKKIVELEGGEISVSNNDDAGCTFKVVLKKQ